MRRDIWTWSAIIILILVSVNFTAGNAPKIKQHEDKSKQKDNAQNIMRQNGPKSGNKNEASNQKKIQLLKTSTNLTREERIHAMGPNGLTAIKKHTEVKIQQFKGKLNNSKELTDKEKDFKLHLLDMFIEELTESERDMIEAQHALRKSLLTDFRDPRVLRDNSKKRLEALRIATLKEEQSFNRIRSIEDAMKLYEEHGNASMSIMDEFLKEIAEAADQLESDIEQKIIPADIPVVDGSHIEAVVHLKEGDEHIQPDDKSMDGLGNDYDERLDVLVDSTNNKFILTRPKDTTSPIIDHYLIQDIILIFVTSFPLAVLCDFIGVPSIFGYIMAGLVLGPSGFNAIQAIVQVETLGEFGVFLIMFFAGLEFSIEKVQKVWKVAVQAPLLISVIMIICGLFIGSLLDHNIPMGASAFVAACMSMSSTPLVVKFLQGSASVEAADYSSTLLAMLVMQDVQLGIIVAILPAFAPIPNPSLGNAVVYTTVMLLRTIGSLVFILVLISFLAKFFIPSFFRYLGGQSKEIALLGALTLMFVLQLATSSIGISMELGCFLAGLLISISNHNAMVEKLMSPLHDLFVMLFFATVGFHVFPRFVAVEHTYLVWLTAAVIGGKFFVSLFVLHWTLPAKQRHMKWLISGGLAQVSEFAFVLASRARNLKIVTREVFLLILSITTLSLIFSPVMWKLSLLKFKRMMRDR